MFQDLFTKEGKTLQGIPWEVVLLIRTLTGSEIPNMPLPALSSFC